MKIQTLFIPFTIAAALASGSAAMAASNDQAVARALGHIKQHGAAVSKSGGDRFLMRDVIVDADGSEHVRFDRTYKGLWVIGGDVVVHSKPNGAFRFASKTLQSAIDVDTNARWDKASAIDLAEMAFDAGGFRNKPTATELVVYARDEPPILAWDVKVFGERNDGTPAEAHYIVDANFPHVVDQWDDIETGAATGSGTGYFSGTVALTTNSVTGGFELKDPARGGQYTVDMMNKQSGSGTRFIDADNLWGDGSLSNRQTVGVDAQYGTAETWDYYLTVHSRNGIANDGIGAYNRVHYGNRYNNAFWSDSCFCMTYGDGDGRTFNPFDSLDVAGHEMSHGVTSRTANLTYSGESGGLNEGNSDIFGTMVEYSANNANDAGDYKIGEKLYKNNSGETKALRYMWSPNKDGASADCWYSGIASLDVHYSSGVANHFYYLLAEGTSGSDGNTSPTCAVGDTKKATGSQSLAGIGRAKAEKIWYRALTVYMNSATKYAGARAVTLQAAADLYGGPTDADPTIPASTEYSAVAAAWSAVNVQ